LLSSIVLVLAVGFSRVFLGVHYPSDIVAGWALAIAWAQRSWSPRGC
jgi:undecaprenyl-diphosphatase